MDPNANLREQRETVREIQRCGDKEHPRETCACADLADRLAELVEGLDNWLSRGGFPPLEWKDADFKAVKRLAR